MFGGACRAVLWWLGAAATWGAASGEDTCPAGGCDRLQLPRVIIGCWQLLERDQDREAAVRTLQAYAHAGFTTFDTADIYGPSERILGQFRKQLGQEEAAPIQFFTKYVTDSSTAEEADTINMRSLTNLGVEALDMVQFHFWTLAKDGSKRAFLQAGQELSRLQRQSKIRHLAGCNMDTTHLQMLVDDGMTVVANQVQYSVLDRRAEVRLLKYCREQGVRLLVFGVVAGGLLSDDFLGLAQSEARGKLNSVSRRMYWSSLERWTQDWGLFQQLLQVLKAVGERREPRLTIASVACEWALHRLDQLGSGGSLILGVRDAGHLEEHTALLRRDDPLTQVDMDQIQAVLDKGNAPRGDIWDRERGWSD